MGGRRVERDDSDMSNWQQLQQRLGGGTAASKRKHKVATHERTEQPPAPPTAAASSTSHGAAPTMSRFAAPAPTIPDPPLRALDALSPRLALDCEMVGVGTDGKRSALARVVVLNFDERIVYSAFVQPPEPVTDYRSYVSGVRPEHMRHALNFRTAQTEVAQLLRDRTLIGHALHNDLKALMLDHPSAAVRDTAHFPPYRKAQVTGSRPRRLRDLAREFLGWEIQGDAHSPAEDAVAALRLYKLKMSEWERAIAKVAKGGGGGKRPGLTGNEAHQTSKWEQNLAAGKSGKSKGRSGIKKARRIKRGVR